MASMDPSAPLMAKQNAATGSVVFCPFKVQENPSTVFMNMHADAQRGGMGF